MDKPSQWLSSSPPGNNHNDSRRRRQQQRSLSPLPTSTAAAAATNNFLGLSPYMNQQLRQRNSLNLSVHSWHSPLRAVSRGSNLSLAPPEENPSTRMNELRATGNNGMVASGIRWMAKSSIDRHSAASRLENTRLTDATCDCHSRDYPPWTGEIHGMSQALLSKSTALRIFWWVVLVICTSCGTATTVLVVIEYIRGPTATSTTIRLVSSLELPAITVCPKIPDAFNFDEMYNDMRVSLPDLRRDTALDLVRFWLGGSGLENMDELPEFNRTYLEKIAQLYDVWSTGYDAQTFFDLVHAKFGYKCQDLFQYCELSGKPRDCCKSLFRRRPVMRRGVCYQTLRHINQTEADDIGRLVLSMKAPPSITSPQFNYQQPQIIIYVNDNYEQVLDFPRFYLYPHEWNRMHFTARLVELLEHPLDCTNRLIGKDSNCFVRNWLIANVIDPYNCTVPYLDSIAGVPLRPTCKPYVIAREYYNAIQLVHSGTVHSQQCLPGCTRWEYSIALQQSPSLSNFMGYAFNLEASFYDLQYEHVKEVYTISVPGFMSQIGGQFGFFLGLSIITMIQITIYFFTALVNRILALLHRTHSRFVAWRENLRSDDSFPHTTTTQLQQVAACYENRAISATTASLGPTPQPSPHLSSFSSFHGSSVRSESGRRLRMMAFAAGRTVSTEDGCGATGAGPALRPLRRQLAGRLSRESRTSSCIDISLTELPGRHLYEERPQSSIGESQYL